MKRQGFLGEVGICLGGFWLGFWEMASRSSWEMARRVLPQASAGAAAIEPPVEGLPKSQFYQLQPQASSVLQGKANGTGVTQQPDERGCRIHRPNGSVYDSVAPLVDEYSRSSGNCLWDSSLGSQGYWGSSLLALCKPESEACKQESKTEVFHPNSNGSADHMDVRILQIIVS